LKHFLSILLALCLSSICLGKVTLEQPQVSVPPGVPLTLSVDGAEAVTARVLVRDDTASAAVGIDAQGGPVVIFTANQPGEYWVLAGFGLSNDESDFAIITVGDAPDPPPPPPPPPVKPATIYLIHETGEKYADPETAVRYGALRNDKLWKDTLKKADIGWEVADDEHIETKLPEVAKAAREHGLPAVVFLDANQKIIKVATQPDTIEAMRAMVKEMAE
jgi:hypothetical protein